MSTVERIEAILNAGRKMPTYRVNLNPDTYKWRIVCGVEDEPIDDVEFETKGEADTELLKLNQW